MSFQTYRYHSNISNFYRSALHNFKVGEKFECLNPLTTKLFNGNFHPLEVVSRWRDPQLQVSENYADLTK